MTINYDLISAVRDGRLNEARELINSFGLSYSQSWAGGYVLLCDAVKNNRTAIAKLLLSSGSKVNSKNTQPTTTVLHLAVMNSDIEIVKMILDKNANVYAKNKYGGTPLHSAIHKYGRTHSAIGNSTVEVIELLLKHGADVNARDNNGASPLHDAVRLGRYQCKKGDIKAEDGITPLHFAAVVKLLLEHGAKTDNLEDEDTSILHLAVKEGYLTIVEDVLNYCPDINNQNSRNSLKIAVMGNGKQYQKIVEALLEYGFTINSEDANNPNFLHLAVKNGHLTIIENLLKYGVDINTLCNPTFEERYTNELKVEKGFTPLHSAVINKHEAVAKLLISFEADINAQDKTGKTPIFYAIENADLKITKLLLTNRANIKDSPELLNIAVKKLCIEIVEALLQHDADINASDKYGNTALHFTAFSEGTSISSRSKGSVSNVKGKIAKLLLNKGANFDVQTNNGITTLHNAIKNGYAKVLEALLEYSAERGNEEISTILLNKGVNVNDKQKDGNTALHIATKKGHKEVVKVLLKYGAKVDSKTESDVTPLHLGAENGYVEIVVSLLEYGSDINITSRNNHTPLDYAMAAYDRVDKRDYRYDDEYYLYQLEKTVETLKRHIVKMKTANLYVSEKNLLSMSSNEVNDFQNEVNDFQNECDKEIAIMKSEKINNSNISFYDIVTKHTSSLAIYMRNENIVQVLKSDNYKTKFTIYASMIETNFKKGMERKELLEQGNKIFHFFFNNVLQLPYDIVIYGCSEKIFSYLSDEDLRILIDACK